MTDGQDMQFNDYVHRNEFLQLRNEFREWRAVVNLRLDHHDQLEKQMSKMEKTLVRIDERQLQMQREILLQNQQTNATMNKQFEQLANAIDRIVDHLIRSERTNEVKG